jgi:hypothetical protein
LGIISEIVSGEDTSHLDPGAASEIKLIWVRIPDIIMSFAAVWTFGGDYRSLLSSCAAPGPWLKQIKRYQGQIKRIIKDK